MWPVTSLRLALSAQCQASATIHHSSEHPAPSQRHTHTLHSVPSAGSHNHKTARIRVFSQESTLSRLVMLLRGDIGCSGPASSAETKLPTRAAASSARRTLRGLTLEPVVISASNLSFQDLSRGWRSSRRYVRCPKLTWHSVPQVRPVPGDHPALSAQCRPIRADLQCPRQVLWHCVHVGGCHSPHTQH